VSARQRIEVEGRLGIGSAPFCCLAGNEAGFNGPSRPAQPPFVVSQATKRVSTARRDQPSPVLSSRRQRIGVEGRLGIGSAPFCCLAGDESRLKGTSELGSSPVLSSRRQRIEAEEPLRGARAEIVASQTTPSARKACRVTPPCRTPRPAAAQPPRSDASIARRSPARSPRCRRPQATSATRSGSRAYPGAPRR
jgi:hypothetical protein